MIFVQFSTKGAVRKKRTKVASTAYVKNKNWLRPFHLVLVMLLLTLSVMIVYSTNAYRHNTQLLREQEAKLQQMRIEQAKLKLEEGTLGDYRRIIEQAQNDLQLQTPLLEQHVRVTP